MEVETSTISYALNHHVLVSSNELFCLVSMMSDREKRDLSEGKWGVGLKNKF